MSDQPENGSAARAQREADEMGVTEDDEAAIHEEFEATGEVPRDKLGNQEGAS